MFTLVQKWIIGLAIVVAVLVGLLMAMSRLTPLPPSSSPTTPGLPSVSNPSSTPPKVVRTPAVSETDSIKITSTGFAPAQVSVKAGAFISWTNVDGRPHTVTGQGFDSGVLSDAATWSHHFTRVGRYDYHDAIHPDVKGTVDVR